jgi:hypothetical protein
MIDLYAGLAALAYAVTAVVLQQQGVADLSDFVAQPQAAGAFGLAALGRWYTLGRKGKQDHG